MEVPPSPPGLYSSEKRVCPLGVYGDIQSYHNTRYVQAYVHVRLRSHGAIIVPIDLH